MNVYFIISVLGLKFIHEPPIFVTSVILHCLQVRIPLAKSMNLKNMKFQVVGGLLSFSSLLLTYLCQDLPVILLFSLPMNWL